MRAADALRTAINSRMIVVPPAPNEHSGGSAVRCKPYNETFSNSASNSRHLLGKAIDFYPPDASPEIVKTELEKLKQNGTLRYWYQISAGSFHMDIA